MNVYKLLTGLIIGLFLHHPVISQIGNGKVYFIRSTGFPGSGTAFTAFIDKQLVCKLNNKRYSVHEVRAGEHTFTVQFAGKVAKEKAEPITINIEEGKSYYIQMVFESGVMVNNLYCQEVTEDSAKRVLAICEEDKKCLPADVK